MNVMPLARKKQLQAKRDGNGEESGKQNASPKERQCTGTTRSAVAGDGAALKFGRS
jgi:hypothetical protein